MWLINFHSDCLSSLFESVIFVLFVRIHFLLPSSHVTRWPHLLTWLWQSIIQTTHKHCWLMLVKYTSTDYRQPDAVCYLLLNRCSLLHNEHFYFTKNNSGINRKHVYKKFQQNAHNFTMQGIWVLKLRLTKSNKCYQCILKNTCLGLLVMPCTFEFWFTVKTIHLWWQLEIYIMLYWKGNYIYSTTDALTAFCQGKLQVEWVAIGIKTLYSVGFSWESYIEQCWYIW